MRFIMLHFEWNNQKNLTNYKKHGVWFEEPKLFGPILIRIISARKTTLKERIDYEKGI